MSKIKEIKNKLEVIKVTLEDLNKIHDIIVLGNSTYHSGNILKTIVHEAVHVHQRYNFELYKELYKEWGYIFVDKIHNFKHILNRKRQNPDADDDNILWSNNNNYYVKY